MRKTIINSIKVSCVITALMAGYCAREGAYEAMVLNIVVVGILCLIGYLLDRK